MLALRPPAIVILVLVAAVSLAGCHDLENLVVQDQEDRDVQSATDTEAIDSGHAGDPQASTNGTDNERDAPVEGNATPRPPHARLLVNETSDDQSGLAPLTIQFKLAADTQNRSRLNWTFDPDDEASPINGTGEELPQVLEHTYTSEGEYNATFIVENDAGRDSAWIAISVEPQEKSMVNISADLELLVHTDIAGHAGEDPGNPSDWPGTARCDLQLANGTNAGEVLDRGVEVGCIEGWSYDEFEGDRFVISIDGLEANGIICVTWPVACQYWEFRVNGEPAEFGIDHYRAADGDQVEFFFYTV